MTSELPSPHSTLLEDVRSILRQARQRSFAAVNTAMVGAYWEIGRRIVQEEQAGQARAEYGAQLVRNLARQLGEEFGSGVSLANLKNFRQFYLTFPDAGKSYALRSLLTWTHWRLVMRVENPAACDYYIRETATPPGPRHSRKVYPSSTRMWESVTPTSLVIVPRMVPELRRQFAESAKLEQAIKPNLREIGYAE